MRRAGFDCTVLEARERPGGRNWTIRKGSKLVFNDGTSQECTFDEGNYFNCGPARLPSIHKTMLGYCDELGVELEVEVNTSRSTLLQNDAVFGGKPICQRQAVNDTRGYVAELLAKCVQQGALNQAFTADDHAVMMEFLKAYGALTKDYQYQGSARSGDRQLPGAADQVEIPLSPLPFSDLLHSKFWRPMHVRGNPRHAGHHASAHRRHGPHPLRIRQFSRHVWSAITHRLPKSEKPRTVFACSIATVKLAQCVLWKPRIASARCR